ncbi:MAG TPA: hypothetical protein VGQ99_15235 [Tepidisphaeraceae bacterium]|nr:hypothetical protein [Tepidisphaeraceae bacterium]
MTRRISLCLIVLAFVFAGVTRAEDKKSPVEGTWKWTVQGQNNQSFEQTMKLKMEGDKVTGVILGRNNTETKIEDATFKDNTLGFTVTRERNGNKFVSKYSGKLDGDTIKGKIETERNGQTQSRDWEAKREKAEKPAA